MHSGRLSIREQRYVCSGVYETEGLLLGNLFVFFSSLTEPNSGTESVETAEIKRGLRECTREALIRIKAVKLS